MMPTFNSPLLANARYLLLQEGDIMQAGDEYYNSFRDQWVPISDGEPDGDGNYPEATIGYEFSHDESKPVRRRNPHFTHDLVDENRQ